MMPLTAYVRCYRKDTSTDQDGDGHTEVGFHVDLSDERNQQWAVPDRPYLMVSMTVSAEAAAQFAFDQTYAVTFAEAAP